MARSGPLRMISLSALTHLTENALSQYLYPDIPFLNVGKLSGKPSRTLRDGSESEHEHTQATAPNVACHTFIQCRWFCRLSLENPDRARRQLCGRSARAPRARFVSTM